MVSASLTIIYPQCWNAVLCPSCYKNIFTSSRSGLGSSCLFGAFGWFGWLFLLTHSDDVNMDLPLAFLLLVRLAGRGGKWERQRKGRRTHDLSFCLSQETLLWGVGVLVGKEWGQKRKRAIAGGAAELGAGLWWKGVHLNKERRNTGVKDYFKTDE